VARPPRAGLFFTVFAISFLVYLRTLAPGLDFGDGPEPATAAWVLGIPHPTGYPLYMLLLHLAMLLPLGEPIVRAGLFSAVCAASAAGLAAIIIYDILRGFFPQWPGKPVAVAATCAGLMTAFLKLFWGNAVVTEVYALHILITLGFVRALQLFDRDRSPRHFLLAALCFGLGIAHHRLSSALFLPLVIMAFVGWRTWGTRRSLRTGAWAALLVIIGLAFYLYIPLRAAARPPINWGDCTTWDNFWRHISGADYLRQRFMRLAPGAPILMGLWFKHEFLILWQLVGDVAAQAFPSQLDEYLVLETRRYFRPTELTFLVGSAVLLFAAIGLWRWWVAHPLTAGLAFLIALQNFSIVLLYNIADISDYTLYVFWCIYVCAFLGLVWFITRVLYPRLRPWVLPRPEYSYALGVIPLAVCIWNFELCDKSDDNTAEELSYFVLPLNQNLLPEGAMLLTYGDYDTFCSWYRQLVRRERTDVFVFGANFISSPWYASFFSKQTLEEHRIRFYDHIPRSPEEFAEALDEGILKYNVGRYSVFTSLADVQVLQILSERYEFNERGLKFIRPRDDLGLQVLHLWEIRPKPGSEEKR